MIRKILNFISKEVSGLHEAAYLLALFAFSSHLLALVRDRLLAGTFGAGETLDIYYASFRIPDLLFVTVASLVSISILVPFFTEYKEKGQDIKQALNSIFSLFFLVMIVVILGVFIFTPQLLKLFFPLITGENFITLVWLTRLILLSPLLLGISNFFASIIQMHNRFFLYALSPILYNAGIIIGIVFLYPHFGLYGLGLGVVLGALCHWLVQVPFVIEKKLFPRITFKPDWNLIKRVVLLSVPRTITLSTTMLAFFALVSLANHIGAGSISILTFSFNLQSVPLSIIGISYSSAVFPLLSRLYSQGDRKAFLERMVTVTRHIVFWSTPVMILFIVLRAQIVRTILGSGNFSWEDTRLTAATLAFFVLSVIPQSLMVLFVRAFYSEGKTQKPLLINIFAALVTIAGGYGLLKLFSYSPFFASFVESLLRIENVSGAPVVMLSLAFTLGVTFNSLLHWIAFHKEFPTYTRSVLDPLARSFFASIIMGYISYLMLGVFDNVFDINTVLGVFLQGLCAGIVGIIAWVIILKLLKSSELDQVLTTLHKKIWKIDKAVTVDEMVA